MICKNISTLDYFVAVDYEDPFIAVEEIDKEVDTQFAKDIEDQVDIMLFLKPKLPQMLDKVVLRKVKKRD